MPLPVPEPAFSNSVVFAAPVLPEGMPRFRLRRIAAYSSPAAIQQFDKRSEDHVDFVIDLSMVMDRDEVILAGSAWTSNPTELVLVRAQFAEKAIVAYVRGGVDLQTYQLSILAKTITNRVIQVTCDITTYGNATDDVSGGTILPLDPVQEPARAYITDTLSATLRPVYADVLSASLSVPLP